MKRFFILSAIFSIALGIYSIWTSVVGNAHNHYQTRSLLLNDSGWRNAQAEWWELTETELSAQPERFARAYRESVTDANKLGRLAGQLQTQCVILAAALFVVSCVGWAMANTNRNAKKEIVQQSGGACGS